jgi:AcrR family transcriptional regulator
MRRPGVSAARNRQILDAAAVFARRGVHAARMDDIA